ncbi:hypothetical protein [Natrinema halophilum]|uniref:Uncharacterized protein n=1 Tax=Natrinema halophilum TaxID=1699371 RepID=A0A7D5L3L2_9EURY|nr:hypothetical protein [Natrinema halophilum]QLG50685.1 hypothetical protein HYG82_18510 [Natrinema halophilum]
MNTHTQNQMQTSAQSLPTWLDRYTTIALYGLGVGTALCLFALFTNPIPDPSFPWATLPQSVRLPFTQPRIEHWPVTYTIGIWLWVFGVPATFFAGWRRYRTRWNTSRTTWLVWMPAVVMGGVTTYCRFFWPKLYPASWNAPSYTFVCWGYCSSYDPLWNNLAYVVALFGVFTGILAYKKRLRSQYWIGAFGVLALPLGLPALYEAYRRQSSQSERSGETV